MCAHAFMLFLTYDSEGLPDGDGGEATALPQAVCHLAPEHGQHATADIRQGRQGTILTRTQATVTAASRQTHTCAGIENMCLPVY